jgi:hypothetical protein
MQLRKVAWLMKMIDGFAMAVYGISSREAVG